MDKDDVDKKMEFFLVSFLRWTHICYLGCCSLCNIVENVEFDRHKMWGRLNYSHHSINFLVYSSATLEANPFKLPEIFPGYKDRHRHSLIIILLRIRHHYFLFFPCLILLRTNLNCRRNCSTRMRLLSIVIKIYILFFFCEHVLDWI